jgi:hypothetical protein
MPAGSSGTSLDFLLDGSPSVVFGLNNADKP